MYKQNNGDCTLSQFICIVLYWFVCLFVCFVIACHCKITAYVGDNKLILIFFYLYYFIYATLQNRHVNAQMCLTINILTFGYEYLR